MKIEYDKVRDTLFGHCFLTAITKANILNSRVGPFEYDVKLTLNGVELPLLKTFVEFEKQVDRMVNERAMNIVSEKLDIIEFNISDLFKEIEDKIRTKLELPKEDDE